MLGLEVTKKVAEGSAVEAFLANSLSGQMLVQVSRPEVSSDPEIYGQFLNWTQAASQLKHPSLLTVAHTRCGSDGRFVVMSGPLSGRTAEHHLAELGPLGHKEALHWARSLCDGLAYLHSHGLVHGHLAPANVFLDGQAEQPLVRLLDTGFLLFRATKSLSSKQVLVPAEYLSPDRVAGQRATAADDVYGFGVLLYELLTGAPPFRGGTPEATREAHQFAPVPQLPASLAAWAVIVQGCLAKLQGDRFSSMRALREALEALQGNAQQTPAIDIVAEPLAERPRADVVTPGASLGAYEVVSELGEGGMGRVYLAKHRTLGRREAIKVLRSELGAASAMARRFVLEAQAVNRVQHPNIVQVFDLVQETPQEGGRIWFVMELLEGQSLKALAHDAPIDLPRVVRFMRQAAEALSAAHAVGVVHRDLKPDNLFVANDTLKVLDFGVAQVRDLNSQAAEIPRTTQVGQVVGTPLWMAPEQILGKDVDARADVYGLATVMYVLLLRKFPFSGAAMTEIVMQRLEHDARPPGNFTFLGEVLPPELSQLLTQCLSRDVAGRPPMSAVALRLSKLEHALADGADDDARASPRQWRRWALAAAAFAGAAGAAWLRLHSL